MKNIKDDTIDQFLLGQLSPSEAAIFEDALGQDAALRRRVNCQKNTFDMLQGMGDMLLWQNITTIAEESTNFRSLKNRRRLFRYISASAAAILLLLTSYVTFWQTSSQDALFEHYFTPYTLDTPRNVAPNDRFEKINTLYKNGAYKDALSFFEKKVEKTDEDYLVMGICYLKTGQAVQAITQFQQLKGSVLEQDALWYEALSCLKINRLGESILLLQQIDTNDSFYGEKAASLLQELEK